MEYIFSHIKKQINILLCFNKGKCQHYVNKRKQIPHIRSKSTSRVVVRHVVLPQQQEQRMPNRVSCLQRIHGCWNLWSHSLNAIGTSKPAENTHQLENLTQGSFWANGCFKQGSFVGSYFVQELLGLGVVLLGLGCSLPKWHHSENLGETSILELKHKTK